MSFPKLKVPYWYLLVVPVALAFVGSALNRICAAANGGAMPVIISNCLAKMGDDDLAHTCGNVHTHLKILSDWLIYKTYFGIQVRSLGDCLIDISDDTKDIGRVIWAALIIRDNNKPTS